MEIPRPAGRKARVAALQSRDKAPTSPPGSTGGVKQVRGRKQSTLATTENEAPAACLRFPFAPSSSSCHLQPRADSGRRMVLRRAGIRLEQTFTRSQRAMCAGVKIRLFQTNFAGITARMATPRVQIVPSVLKLFWHPGYLEPILTAANDKTILSTSFWSQPCKLFLTLC